MKKYVVNDSVVSNCIYQTIWCTMYKRELLTKDIAAIIKNVAREECSKNGGQLRSMEIHPRLVRMTVKLPSQMTIHGLIKDIKSNTFKQVKELYPETFKKVPSLWTNAYYAETIGNINDEAVDEFIANQKVSQRQ